MPGLSNPYTLYPQLLLCSLELICTVFLCCPVDHDIDLLPLKSVSYILRLLISPPASYFQGQTSHLFHSFLKVKFLGLNILAAPVLSYAHVILIVTDCFELFSC